MSSKNVRGILHMENNQIRNKRKLEIQQAASDLFLTIGFKDTSMDAIVKKTSLSKGGVYYYYTNTTDILFDIMIQGNSYRANQYESISIDSSTDQVDMLAEIIVSKMLAYNEFLPLYVIFLKESQTNQKLKDLLLVLKKDAILKLSSLLEAFDIKYRSLVHDELIMNLINSILLGSVILDANECFTLHKDALKEMIKFYIKLETEE